MSFDGRCQHDPRDIVEDSRGGVVCTRCGTVLDAILIDEGCANVALPPPSGAPGPLTRLQRRVWTSECDDETNVPLHKLKESRDAIAEISYALQLIDGVRATAEHIHATALARKEGGFRGEHFRLSAISSVYFACIVHRVARGEAEFVANVESLGRSKLTSMNKTMRRLLSQTQYASAISGAVDPASLIPRFVAVLCSPPSLAGAASPATVRREMHDLLSRPRSVHAVEGRTPECVCAAAFVHVLERASRTCDRKAVSSRCGVSVASIAAIARELAS